MKQLLALLLIASSVTLCGCIYLPTTTTMTSTTEERQSDKPDETSISIVGSNPSETSEESSTTEVSEEKGEIEIVKEYTYSDGFWYTYHFVVVKNVSNIPLSIDTDTLAYGEDGALISVGSGNVVIVEPGYTTIYYESFETTDKIAKYETTTTIERPLRYKYSTSNLSYEMTDIKNGKIVQVTNNGNDPTRFVEGYLLYFKNGNIVGWDENYFTDSDSEIKPGKTISQQYTIYSEFDSVEFYLTGRR
jgi:hypothetical protein